MNIFLREVKANLKSLIIWGGIMVLFMAAGMAEYIAYADNPEMLEILDPMPPAMIDAFSLEAFNLTTVSGFWGYMFIYFVLMASIAAAMWGSEIISKEERDKTVEFSLTLPVPRGRLVTAKLLAAMVNCIGLLLITWGTSLALVEQYQPDNEFYEFLFLCMVAMFILQMVFLAVGVFLGCAIRQYKRANSVAVSLILVMYFFSMISDLSEDLEFLKHFSPFKFFSPADLLHKSEIDITYVWVSAGIILVALVGGYVAYAKRDMYI